jgi:uncharacterized protein YjeT (DUF2065 family)
METSIFIAQIIAVVYVLAGLGMLLNKAYYHKGINAMLKDSGFLLLGGMLSTVAGFLIITYHNIWVQDWTVIITIFGWLALIKGILFLVFPNKLDFITDMYKKQNMVNIAALVALVIGVILGYYGFFV